MTENGSTREPAASAPGDWRWVPVTGPLRPPQAAALATVLEEAGIPVHVAQLPSERGYAVERWLAWPVCLGQQLLVPEDSLVQAQAALAKAPLEPQRWTAQEAPAGSAPMPPPSLDPMVDKMRALAAVAPEQREECLAQALTGWIAEGVLQHKVLEYLCAAGLPPEEARARMEQEIEARRRFERVRVRRFLAGTITFVLGALWLLAALRSHPAGLEAVDAGSMALMATGVFVVYTALSMKPDADREAPASEGGPEGKAAP